MLIRGSVATGDLSDSWAPSRVVAQREQGVAANEPA